VKARGASAAGAGSAGRGSPHEVRIVGGQWKRSRLPVADRPGLRPTPDRVRETLFNWLGQDLSGWRCLDAFAGSGALGFEAASRGAAEVVLLERDATLVQSLRLTAQRLHAANLWIECADAIGWMARAAPASFDLVLLDPPFEAGIGDAALAAALPLAAPGGRVYVEAGAALAAPPPGWQVLRRLRAGAVHAHLLGHAAPA
jgi:16S rRNA (guanine(966)-N(2))-methyltransferase RsmD